MLCLEGKEKTLLSKSSNYSRVECGTCVKGTLCRLLRKFRKQKLEQCL